MQTCGAFRNHSGTRGAPAHFVRRAFQNGSGMHRAFAYFSPLHRSGEMNAGISCCSSLIVSRAVCAGALSCNL